MTVAFLAGIATGLLASALVCLGGIVWAANHVSRWIEEDMK